MSRPHFCNENELKLLDYSVRDLIQEIESHWPTHSITMAAFQHYMPKSPKGETVVQVQIRIVTDDTDFLEDFTKELINNHNS